MRENKKLPLQAKILIVDDDEAITDSLSEILEDDYDVICVDRGQKAIDEIKTQVFDLVLLDIKMPEMDGIETLKRIRFQDSEIDVIMISAVDSAQKATESIKLGAYDYITKPFDHEIILNRVEKVLERRKLSKLVNYHNSKDTSQFLKTKIISQSRNMTELFDMLAKVIKTSSNVLITGESGTGKELIAKAIHYESPRNENPFVAINCAAIPSELMESELFGHEKGSFTGAHKRGIGKMEYAHHGTVFLDEVSSLNLSFQAKLLRFLQEREFTRVGSHQIKKVDIRIIAATNTKLKKMVKEGTFREDLFFRLNVVPVTLPPLRDRKGDVPLLADFFLARFNNRMNKKIMGFSPDAIAAMETYPWRGNVRELENLVERMVVLGSDNRFIDERDLPFDLLANTDFVKGIDKETKAKTGLIPARNDFERRYILRGLENCRWNQTRTAVLLNIHRNTLLQKMKSLNLTYDKVTES